MHEDLIEHELPPRPRHRLLGAGGSPVAVALVGVLLCACGFIGGVLVEKGQTQTTGNASSGGGLASRLASLRAGSGSTGTGSASRSGGLAALLGGSGARSGPGAGTGAGGGAGAPTVGQVAYVHGNTLYVTNPEGNTIKVTASAGSAVSRTVKASVAAIHPGETVIVTGSAGSSGTIHAQSIRASEAGASGGLGAISLFGGGGATTRSESGSSGGGRGAEGPVLFGK